MEVNGYKIKPSAYLRDTDLAGADLAGADLTLAKLERANLTGAVMEDGSRHD